MADRPVTTWRRLARIFLLRYAAGLGQGLGLLTVASFVALYAHAMGWIR